LQALTLTLSQRERGQNNLLSQRERGQNNLLSQRERGQNNLLSQRERGQDRRHINSLSLWERVRERANA
jgi:hypothetical protein